MILLVVLVAGLSALVLLVIRMISATIWSSKLLHVAVINAARRATALARLAAA